MRKYFGDIDENAIIERVRLLRNQYAGARGRSKFARDLGISSSTYSYYETNRMPPVETLLKICELTGADLHWLLTGRSPQASPIKGPNSEMLRKLSDLLTSHPELGESVAAFVELLCQKKGIEAALQPASAVTRPDKTGWIPVLGRTAAGLVHFWSQALLPASEQIVTELDELVNKHTGKPIVGSTDKPVLIDLQARPLVERVKKTEANLVQVGGQDEEIVEFVECEEIHRLFPDSFALHVDGDSMSPRINDGDIVIISPSVPAAEGHIAIARVANQIGVTCKLIRTTAGQVHLIPINEKYETKVVPRKDLLWALAVLCHLSV